MNILSDLKMYARFAWGLRNFLHRHLTLDQAQSIVRRHEANRETNFLQLMDRGIFGHAKSPYLPLLRMADCEQGDLHRMVKDKGLETTLTALREAGVYVTFEETKGRRPIIRNGREFPVSDHDFDNPYLKRQYAAESGGSTGPGTRVHHDLDHLADQTAYYMLTQDAHGVLEAPNILWRGILPDGSGMNGVLRTAHYGKVPQKWFSPVAPHELGWRLIRFRLATYYFVVLSRLFGVSVPWPETVRISEARTVARCVARTLEDHGACVINTVASRGLRVAIAAREEGLDLNGATFMVAGEPVTPAKFRGITSTGASCFSLYGFSEIGRIGMGCSRPVSSNDLHLLTGICAIIPFPREVPGSDITVPAFNVTSLLPSSPKILLNAESDDYGVLERRTCGCPLGDLGLNQHVRDIRSFRKLTGEGVTLVGCDILNILEEVLPATFGGSPLDYQLQEEEDAEGFTKINLIVSPQVKLQDESKLIEKVLEAMAKESIGSDAARSIWAQTDTIKIKRREPIWTGRGKLMPLHVIRPGMTTMDA